MTWKSYFTFHLFLLAPLGLLGTALVFPTPNREMPGQKDITTNQAMHMQENEAGNRTRSRSNLVFGVRWTLDGVVVRRKLIVWWRWRSPRRSALPLVRQRRLFVV